MDLFYCRNVEDLARVLTSTDIVAGTTLDKLSTFLADRVLAEERMRTAQAELEQLLCSRFNIPQLRQSNAEYLRYAHAVITWWHLESVGKGRELVRQKYEDLLNVDSPLSLARITSIVRPDGSSINSGADVAPVNTTIRKSRVLGGRRSATSSVGNPFNVCQPPQRPF